MTSEAADDTHLPEKDGADTKEKAVAEMEAAGLEKKLTLIDGIAIIVGCIIGSGIFVSPKGVLQEVGSVGASLIVWIISGLVSMVGAYCYVELGCMIKDSGADYAYMYRAFGPFMAFLRIWVESVILRPTTQAIVALAFAKYIIFPLYPDCPSPASAERLLAAVCIFLLTLVNCASVRLAAMIQNIFTVGKVLALIVIIITGISQMGMGRVENFQNIFEGSTTDVSKIALSFYSGLFAYSGWHYLNYVIEEMKNPKRDLPLAIVISCIIVIIIYVLAIMAYHSVVGVTDILSTPAVAVLFASKVFGPYGAWIMPIFVSMSTFGTVNGILFTSARLCYVGGRKGHMPKLLNMVQVERSTPVPAVIFTSVIALCSLVSTDIFALINCMGFVIWLVIGASVFILIYLRYKEPDLERPVKVWLGFPIGYLIFTVYMLVFAFYASPRESAIGLLIILTGVPVYLVCVSWKKKPKVFENLIKNFTILCQKIFMLVPEKLD